jgi:hypothetical protein
VCPGLRMRRELAARRIDPAKKKFFCGRRIVWISTTKDTEAKFNELECARGSRNPRCFWALQCGSVYPLRGVNASLSNRNK